MSIPPIPKSSIRRFLECLNDAALKIAGINRTSECNAMATWDDPARDRVFFKHVRNMKDVWRDGYQGEVGRYMESIGHWYQLERTQIEEEGGWFLLTCLFRYKRKGPVQGVDFQPNGGDLGEFVRKMELREWAPDAGGRFA